MLLGSENNNMKYTLGQLCRRAAMRPYFGSLAHLSILLFLLLFSACNRPAPQFQENFALPGGTWPSSFQPTFQFDIEDTAAAYQLQLVLRHTDVYPFSNIWISLESKAPGDTAWGKVRVEVPLAAVSGQWLGRGMGAIYEQRAPITSLDRPAFFPKQGRYQIRLSQDMRRDPLPEVLSVGLRIEQLPHYQKEK